MNKEMIERRITRIENLLNEFNKRKYYEEVQLSAFDCQQLADSIETLIANKVGKRCDVDITDDNADYGYINVGIECDGFANEYDVRALDYDLFEVMEDNETFEDCESLEEVAQVIANRFIEEMNE